MNRQWSRVIIAELMLLLLAFAIFVYMWIVSMEWELGAALFPRIAASLGMVAILAYGIQRVGELRHSARAQAGQILDLQWSTGDVEPAVLRRRAILIVASVIGLWVGIWLVGFHIAVPIYLFSQLKLFGDNRWWSAALVALVGLALIVGVYDELLRVSWHEPLLGDWWKSLIKH